MSEETKDTKDVSSNIVDINKDITAKRWQITLLGLYHVIWALVCGYLIYNTWPELGDIETFSIKKIIYLVMLAWATGSFIHSAGSFISFVGNEQLQVTWFWWYLLRPFLGMSVAVVFFIIFRSGYLSDMQARENSNPYSFLAICTLAGTFSDLATLKLKEIFESLFKPKDDRKGKLKPDKEDANDFDESDSKA